MDYPGESDVITRVLQSGREGRRESLRKRCDDKHVRVMSYKDSAGHRWL